MKNQKQPFTSIEKIAAEIFFEIRTEAVVQTKSHIAEAVGRRCSIKKGVPKACNFIKKETLTQVLPCEFC